jgi:membrane fusion protein, copper/silver efflux system
MKRVLVAASAVIAIGLVTMISRAGQDRPYQDPDGKPFDSAIPSMTADGRDGVAEEAASRAPPPPQAGGDHRILYYRNPMGLPDTSPKPKNDSMGMAYIPVYADEGSQDDPPGTVRISPGQLQTLGVKTEAATMRSAAARAVRATGSLQFDERHLATVTTKVPGWIEHLAVAATGDTVRSGQVLAEIYSPDLVASEEEYLIAARMGGAIGAASDQRLRALDVPAEEIARLRRTGRSSARIPVMASANGIVVDKPLQEGMRVDAGEALYKTADLSDIWLDAQVQEQDLGAIRVGARTRATFVAFPGRTFEGTVDFIYPTLSAETRTARVRIVMRNPDGSLRAAMFANVEIDASASAELALSVPSSAVLDSGTQQVVLVARGEGRFEPRVVHLGIKGEDWIQVLDGVKPGEQVVVSANFLIDSESNLRAALQGFADGSKQGATP